MIYTFYSYKGGVGRTHLLANIAAYLCYYQKRKVLMIDWDLEAPGLHFYFKKDNNNPDSPNLENEDITSKGLIDLLNKHIDVLVEAKKGTTFTEDNFFNPFEKKGDYIQNLVDAKNGGQIDLIPAIHYHENYHKDVESFDWIKFYDQLYGGTYLLWLKQELKKKYDYVLIDSRTGFNDYSGICNVLMPDMNLILVAPNRQNFDGAKKMINRIIGAEYTQSGKRKPFVLPVLSRVDRYNNKKMNYWVKEFTKEFAFTIPVIDENLKAYTEEILDIIVDKTILYYNAEFALGENTYFTEDIEGLSSTDDKKSFENIVLEFLERMNKKGEMKVMEVVGHEMIPVYLKNIKENPEDFDSHFGLGLAYANDLENYEKAKEYFEKAVEIKPNDFLSWYNLGFVYDRLENYEEAIKAYEKAIEIKADYEYAWNGLGWIYFIQGKIQEAKPYFEKSISSPQAKMNLAYIELIEGNQDKAIDLYKESLANFESKDKFFEDIEDDYQHLEKHGISKEVYQGIIKELKK